MIDFQKLCKDTGLTQLEASRVFGVSRPTFNRWCVGAHAPHMLIESQVKATAKVVKQAVKEGLLPPPASVKRKLRAEYIRRVLAHSQKLLAN